MADDPPDGRSAAPNSQTVPAVLGSVGSIGAATAAVFVSLGPAAVPAVIGVVATSAAITGVIERYIRRRKKQEELEVADS
ncbi:hypothetical protein [Actinomadura litoris]|uniref:Uncharacterized protein n=1 Tax=Actinomadura litoris TaxID=2678616 RepID=A0A7K1KTN0_9ACTN|nr:hypothetical protein [Actinomadura litoris]MUN35544.1 hypothetical protein [Actinomadura litoris]